jgi:hypothetical protein
MKKLDNQNKQDNGQGARAKKIVKRHQVVEK